MTNSNYLQVVESEQPTEAEMTIAYFTIDCHNMAARIASDVALYAHMEDELYKAKEALGEAWYMIRKYKALTGKGGK